MAGRHGTYCADCRDGEHMNYDDDVLLTYVRRPDGKLVKRAYLCREHRTMYADDGYEVTERGTP